MSQKEEKNTERSSCDELGTSSPLSSNSSCDSKTEHKSDSSEFNLIENSRTPIGAEILAFSPNKNSNSNQVKLRFLGTPGPFQVIDSPQHEDGLAAELAHPPEGPRRRYDCNNYETCLNLAAALNWDSFTCRGCSSEVNQKLLWRAQHEVRKDIMAKAICDLPDPRDRKIENANSAIPLKLIYSK